MGYNWDALKYWIHSINRSGFEGDKVLIQVDGDRHTADKIVGSGFQVLRLSPGDTDDRTPDRSTTPVQVQRFMHIYNYLITCTNEYRYVIATDVRDVIFQKDPSIWLDMVLGAPRNQMYNCVFSSESIRYKDERWGRKNFLDTYGPYIYSKFRHKEIFNVGVLAGRSRAICDLSINIYASAINRPEPICDQSTFNFLIGSEPYLSTNIYARSEDGWACQLGTTVDPAKREAYRLQLLEPPPNLEGDRIVTSRGAQYTVVHQYDRVPNWRRVIEEKYG
jgi:hypothetical protein